MYQLFVGVDVSKAWIDVAMWIEGHAVYVGQYNNGEAGFEACVAAISCQTDVPLEQWFVCFENTGGYSKALLYWLLHLGIPCREENPLSISRSKGLTRGKDDALDAQTICTYAVQRRETIQPSTIPCEGIVQLKKLLSRRELLVRQRASLKQSKTAPMSELADEVQETLQQQAATMIELYDQQIKSLERLMHNLVNQYQAMRTNFDLANSVIGVGPIIAWTLIATTENFTAFPNARKFACYCGVAPFPHRSGKSLKGRDRVHFLANKTVKAHLSNGARSAIIADPELRAYYERKRAEGKEYGTVINAIKNKLIQRVFAVVQRQQPYVRLMSYAS